MSELEDYKKNSKAATGALGAFVVGVIGVAAKAFLSKVDDGVRKTESEERLRAEESRKGVSRLIHKEDRAAARENYDKYHEN